MASYQARQRDPLIDSHTRAQIQRHGGEALGVLMLGAGLAMALLLASYTPNDPGWMAASDEPVRNLLGRVGAAVAAALMIIAGHGAWALPVLLIGWGLRFVLHRGAERCVARAVTMPIAAALAALYAATLVPGPGWNHSFGLGGLFGDTVLGLLLNLLPVQAALGLRLVSLLLAALLLASGLHALGFVRGELRALMRYLGRGLGVAGAGLVGLMRRGLRAGAEAGRTGLAHTRALQQGSARDRAACRGSRRPRSRPRAGRRRAPRRRFRRAAPARARARAGTRRGRAGL